MVVLEAILFWLALLCRCKHYSIMRLYSLNPDSPKDKASFRRFVWQAFWKGECD